jgi:hypothetical protein
MLPLHSIDFLFIKYLLHVVHSFFINFYSIPVGFAKPAPVPVKTRTRGGGCGFVRVRVRAALENPRVARDIPYPQSLVYHQAPLNDPMLGESEG